MSSRPKTVSKERIYNSSGGLDNRAIQTSLDKITNTVNILVQGNLSHTNLIKDIEITTGTTKIKHGLGRDYTGYILILSDSATIIYVSTQNNVRKKTELWLTGTTTATISILVF